MKNDFGLAKLELYINSLNVVFPWMTIEYSYSIVEQCFVLTIKTVHENDHFVTVCRGDTYSELLDELKHTVSKVFNERTFLDLDENGVLKNVD